MPNEHLSFVKEALASGASRPDIAAALKSAGWPEDEVKTALDAFADAPFRVPVPRRRPSFSAREAFVYLLLFLCLYLAAWSFGATLFNLIERALPDVLSYSGQAEPLRLSVSMLFVSFPVYLWLSGLTGGWVRRDPDKRSSPIRKWLTYLTLFVAAGTIIGDLITLLYNLLGGDLTTRFVLKVLVVLVIAALAFGYYLWSLRREEGEAVRTKVPRLLAAVTGVLAAAAIIAGIVATGAPSLERARRFDDQRSAALDQIAASVAAYSDRQGRVPDSLETLAIIAAKGDTFWLPELTDPQTGVPYTYERTGDLAYRLCADFEAEARPETTGAPTARPVGLDTPSNPNFREHGVGRTCWDVDLTNRFTFCDNGRPCTVGTECLLLPSRLAAVCVAEGKDCAAAGCPGACDRNKSNPPQITCRAE